MILSRGSWFIKLLSNPLNNARRWPQHVNGCSSTSPCYLIHFSRLSVPPPCFSTVHLSAELLPLRSLTESHQSPGCLPDTWACVCVRHENELKWVEGGKSAHVHRDPLLMDFLSSVLHLLFDSNEQNGRETQTSHPIIVQQFTLQVI